MQQRYDNLGDSLQRIDWKHQTLKSFARNFYKVTTISFNADQEHTNVTARSEDDVRKFRREN